jgi:hypothetical protein
MPDTYLPLTGGQAALVDAEDAALLTQYDWYVAGTILLPLGHGLATLVLTDDATWLCERQWRPMRIRRTWYAVAAGHGPLVYMHRVIYEWHHGPIPAGHHVDHINGDGLTNLLANLRLATVAQNRMNSAKRAGCSSRYKGVDWHSSAGAWRAKIKLNGRTIWLGHWPTEEKAAAAYDAKARELFGDFARLNLAQGGGMR